MINKSNKNLSGKKLFRKHSSEIDYKIAVRKLILEEEAIENCYELKQDEDIYDQDYLEELEESDEITPEEEGFMGGYNLDFEED